MQTAFLKPLADATGPVATVCLDVGRTGEKTAAELELKVRAATARLVEQGAPRAVTQLVADRLLAGDDRGAVTAEAGRLVNGMPVAAVLRFADVPAADLAR